MKPTIRKATGILFMALTLTACTKKDNPDITNDKGGKATEEKGYATGKVVDGKGNPIAGAKIYIDNTVFYDSYLTGTTGENGTYKIKLQPGAWMVYANFKTEYNGETYNVQAFPDSEGSLTEDGGVRNFTWKLEGIDPNDDYYYGGRITVFTATDFYEDESDIELTFTPSGPLIDGSEGQTLVLQYGERYWQEYGYIEDFPVGRYIVTAVLKGDDGDTPLKIQNWHTQGNFVSEYQLDFIPDDSDFRPNATASIVIGY